MSLDATVRVERRVDPGTGTVGDALRALADSAGGVPERWLLPSGTFTLGETIDLGAIDVALLGVGTILEGGGGWTAEALVVEALDLRGPAAWSLGATGRLLVEDVRADGGALHLAGADVAAVGLSVANTVGHAVEITSSGPVLAAALALGPVTGDVLRALEARGTTVDLRRVVVSAVNRDATAPTRLALTDGWIDTAGIVVLGTTVTLSEIEVRSVAGGAVIGARILSAGAAYLTDLGMSDVRGDSVAVGLLAAATGDLVLRGFGVEGVSATLAEAVRVGGTAAVELAGGRVVDVLGSGGRAAGVRVLLPPTGSPIEVRDVHVEGVGRWLAGGADLGILPIAPPAAPAPAHAAWARDLASTLTIGAPSFPALPAPTAPDIAGIHIDAAIEEWDALTTAAPLCEVEDSVLARIAGPALLLAASLRRVAVRRILAHAAARPGWIAGEDVLLAEWTAHLHTASLGLGPGSFRLYNSLTTGIVGATIERIAEFPDDVDLVEVGAVHAVGDDPRFRPLGALPYRNAGPATLPERISVGEIPPPAEVDLSLLPGVVLPPAAIPEDETAPQLGAIPPSEPAGCDARDPDPPALPSPLAAPPPSPVADYLARDYEAFRALLFARADQVLPGWTERGAADLTTTLLELFADRLDLLAQAQEATTAEFWLDTARLRRSVEDHARQLGYTPDPGLSASAILRFHVEDVALGADIDPDALRAADGTVTVPAGTLVSLASHRDGALVFATDEDLVLVPGTSGVDGLDALILTEDVEAGANRMEIQPWRGTEHLVRGRWLLLYDPSTGDGHVVRATVVEAGVEGTVITWDPRRPSPRLFSAAASVVHANVVPAQHGIPLAPGATDPLFGSWNALLDLRVDGSRLNEVTLPVGPISIQAQGWPFPSRIDRDGEPVIAVEVEGDRWTRGAELSTARAGEEIWVLRNDADAPVLRFGDGVNGEALPGHEVAVRVAARIGLGERGNVGADTLVSLLRLGAQRADEEGLADRLDGVALFESATDILGRWLKVTNPIAAVGGRDPEPLDRIRYRAPLAVDDLRSAVTAADYEALLAAVPEVAAVRARVERRLPRPLVRLTLLLRDEDTLPKSERLRRWAELRVRLDAIRLIGTDVELIPPTLAPLDLDIVIDAADHAPAAALGREVEAALRADGGLFDPDRQGLGTDVHLSEIYRAVLDVVGVRRARVKRFRRIGQPDALGTGMIGIGPTERATFDGGGVLTVTVCGGRQ